MANGGLTRAFATDKAGNWYYFPTRLFIPGGAAIYEEVFDDFFEHLDSPKKAGGRKAAPKEAHALLRPTMGDFDSKTILHESDW